MGRGRLVIVGEDSMMREGGRRGNLLSCWSACVQSHRGEVGVIHPCLCWIGVVAGIEQFPSEAVRDVDDIAHFGPGGGYHGDDGREEVVIHGAEEGGRAECCGQRCECQKIENRDVALCDAEGCWEGCES